MASARADRVAVRRFSIHDRELAVVGYALACDSSELQLGRTCHSGAPAPEALFGAMSFGVQRIIADKRLFIAANSLTLLEGEWLTSLPPRSVIMAGPNVGESPKVLARCRQLADAGYAIALDVGELQALTDEVRSVAAFLTFDGAGVPIQIARRLVARRDDLRLLAR